MKIKNTYSYITAIIVCTLFMQSCFLLAFGPGHKRCEAYAYSDYTHATIINYTVDGCSWMLQLEDGKKLQPLILAPEFQKEGLKVLIKYEVKKDAVGVCMVGEIVSITEIIKSE
jgi:hypothetical protein